MRDGARFFPGADREMLPPHFSRIVNALVARTDAPVADRGMVDGNPGFLLVIGQEVPD